MDSSQFLKNCEALVESMVMYRQKLKRRKIAPTIAPGQILSQMSSEMPLKGESFNQIMDDFNEKVMPGIVHWAHPRFFGYLPSSTAYPSILADMLCHKMGIMGFSWIASPSITELEVCMADWVGRSLGLPNTFLNGESASKGGGVFVSSGTECAITAMVAARQRAIVSLRTDSERDAEITKTLVAYCSEETHSCIQKASNLCSVQLRVLETQDDCTLSPETLEKAMKTDTDNGLHPCFVCITLGTTSTGAYDSMSQISLIARRYPLCWIHVNATYGGCKFICPEMREEMQGIEQVDSFAVELCKGLLVNVDSTLMWVQNKLEFCSGLVVDPLYLQHKLADQHMDLRHWSLFLSRRCRALKVWYTYRLYGVDGLREHVRKMHLMANKFKNLVTQDDRFELCNKVLTPMVCFRLKGTNEQNYRLLAVMNKTRRILVTPALVKDKFVLRLVVSHEETSTSDIEFAWEVILKSIEKMYDPEVLELVSDSDCIRRLSYTKRVSLLDYQRYNPKRVLKDSETTVVLPYDPLDDPLDFEDFSP